MKDEEKKTVMLARQRNAKESYRGAAYHHSGKHHRPIAARESSSPLRILVEQKRLANVLNFWNGAFEVKGFGENNFEDLMNISRVPQRDEMGDQKNLLHVDAVTGAAEDQAGLHGLGKSFRLPG